MYGTEGTLRHPGTPDVNIDFLYDIPVIGDFLGDVFGQLNLMAWLALLLLVATWVVLFKTPLGLRIRSVGEHPRAADTVGISVYGVRYFAVTLSGVLAALGGAYLSIGFVHSFSENMTAGRGFIALAAVIFGAWRPFGAFAAALLFGFSSALAQRLDVYSESAAVLFQTLPYVLTLIAVAGVIGRSIPPGSGWPPVQEAVTPPARASVVVGLPGAAALPAAIAASELRDELTLLETAWAPRSRSSSVWSRSGWRAAAAAASSERSAASAGRAPRASAMAGDPRRLPGGRRRHHDRLLRVPSALLRGGAGAGHRAGETSPNRDVFEIGSSLKDARLRQGIDLAEAELTTKIRSKYLRALEEERFDVLARADVREGFLRSYADFLGLDGQLYVDEYNSRYVSGDDETAFRPRRSYGARAHRRVESRAVVVALVAIAAVAALVVIAARWGRRPRRDPELSAGDGPREGAVLRRERSSWIGLQLAARRAGSTSPSTATRPPAGCSTTGRSTAASRAASWGAGSGSRRRSRRTSPRGSTDVSSGCRGPAAGRSSPSPTSADRTHLVVGARPEGGRGG